MANDTWVSGYDQNAEEQRKAAQLAELNRLSRVLQQPDPTQPNSQQQDVPNITVTGAANQPKSVPQKEQTADMGSMRGAWEGTVSATKNAINAIDDLGNWLNDNIIDLRTESQQKAYQTYKQTGVRGYAQEGTLGNFDLHPVKPSEESGILPNLAYKTSEFLVGFIPALKATRVLSGGAALSRAGQIAQTAVASGLGTAATYSPEEERVASWINAKLPEEYRPAVLSYLAGDPNDTELESRFKTGLENAALGAVGDIALAAIFKGVKAAKMRFFENGTDPTQILDGAAKREATTTAVKSELDNILTTADEAAATGAKQADVVVSKELGDHLTKVGSSYDIESLRATRKAMDDVPVPHEVSPQTAGVLPEVSNAVKAESTDAEVNSMVDALLSGKELTKEELATTGINYSKINTQEELHQILGKTSQAFAERIKASTGGVQSLKDIKQSAKELGDLVGSDPRYLEQLGKDTTDLAARFQFAKTELIKSANALDDMTQYALETSVKRFASEAEREQAIGLSLLALRKQVLMHGEIQAWVKGTETEIGRAMSAMRITTKDARYSSDEIRTLIDGFGGEKLNVELAHRIASLRDNPGALNQLVRKSGMVKTMEVLQEVFMNSILSGPITQATNIVGNTLRMAAGVAETGLAAGIGKTRRMIARGEWGSAEAAEYSDALAQLVGMKQGLTDVLRAIKNLDWNDSVTRIVPGAKFDEATSPFHAGVTTDNISFIRKDSFFGKFVDGISALDLPIAPKKTLGDILPENSWAAKAAEQTTLGLGAAIRSPGWMLQKADEAFKLMNYRGSLSQQATKLAKSEGLFGDDLVNRIATLINDPPEDMMKIARLEAQDATFSKSLSKDGGTLDKMGIWLQTAKNEGVNGKALLPALNYVVPFIKTPTNILNYTWDHMPILAQARAGNWAILKAGGIEADRLIAKQTLGLGAMMMGGFLASEGLITGGLHHMTADQIQVSGMQKYSFYNPLTKEWTAFNRIDPIGTFLGLTADMVNLSGHVDEMTMEELSVAFMTSMGSNLASKTYMQSVFGFFNAVGDTQQGNDKAMSNFITNYASSMIPFKGLRTQLNRAYGDDQIHELNGFMDRIRSTIPGLSSSLPPHRNLLTGEPVVYEGGMGVDIASPFYTRKEVDDPAAQAIAELHLTGFKHPPKRYQNVDLTPAQYDRLMVIMTKELGGSGNTMHDKMNRLVTSEKWKHMTSGDVNGSNESALSRVLNTDDVEHFDPGSREYALMQIFGNYKRAAYQQLKAEDPTFRAKLEANSAHKQQTLLGIPVNQ